tara:strand:+ start:171 stop:941 length:771 start_codon:yes stop_codon:yes gene_type:complete
MTKFARFSINQSIKHGIVDGNTIQEISKPPYEDYSITKNIFDLSNVSLLSPVQPSKIIAIGLNYKSHLGRREIPKVPEPFFKTPSSLIGPEDSIIIPKEALDEKVIIQPEAEMVVVIGQACKNISSSESMNYILGFTCGNDVSARDWQKNDLQWWRAKSCDTFTSLGPIIETELDHNSMKLKGYVNEKLTQEQTTSDLIHNVPKIIEFVSKFMTLLPGDVIMTGTPGDPPDIHPGDTTIVEIENLGSLKNYVEAEI